MVMIKGIAANLDLYPTRIKIEQKNSAKVANTNDNSGPRPIGSEKLKSPRKRLTSFGIPWLSIETETTIRTANSAQFIKGP